MHANTDGPSCIQYGRMLAHKRCSVIFFYKRREVERAKQGTSKIWECRTNGGILMVSFGGMTGKVKNTADGERDCMCVCDFLLVVPPSLPSLLVHPLNICPSRLSSPLGFLITNPSPHRIFCCVISISFLCEYKCGWHACFRPLCSISVVSDVFLSTNTRTRTHTCLFRSVAKVSSKGCLISSSFAQAPHGPVGWGYKAQGRAEIETCKLQNRKNKTESGGEKKY